MKNVATILTIALLGVVSVLGINYARAANDTAGVGNGQNMLDQAVENGVVDRATADKLQTYNQEQRQAQMKERMEERLNTAVEEGSINTDEAQQIRDWQASRPEAMDKVGGFGRGQGMGQGCPMSDDNAQTSTESS